MHDLSIIKYMNGTPKYKRMIDRRVRIIKIKEWFRQIWKWLRVISIVMKFKKGNRWIN